MVLNQETRVKLVRFVMEQEKLKVQSLGDLQNANSRTLENCHGTGKL